MHPFSARLTTLLLTATAGLHAGCVLDDESGDSTAESEVASGPESQTSTETGSEARTETKTAAGTELEADLDASTPAPEPDSTCTPWFLHRNRVLPDGVTADASIADAVLTLSVDGNVPSGCLGYWRLPCAEVQIFQSQLTGDFAVTAEIESVTGGGTLDGVGLYVAEPGAEQLTYTQLRLGARRLTWTRWNRGSFASESIAATAPATLRIERTAGNITVEATHGTRRFVRTGFHVENDLTVGLTLDAETATTARVRSFTVEGGGGDVVSDAFDGACPL